MIGAGETVALLIPIVVLALDLFALRHIWGSRHRTPSRVLWSAWVLVVPLLGFAAWLLIGPRRHQRA